MAENTSRVYPVTAVHLAGEIDPETAASGDW